MTHCHQNSEHYIFLDFGALFRLHFRIQCILLKHLRKLKFLKQFSFYWHPRRPFNSLCPSSSLRVFYMYTHVHVLKGIGLMMDKMFTAGSRQFYLHSTPQCTGVCWRHHSEGCKVRLAGSGLAVVVGMLRESSNPSPGSGFCSDLPRIFCLVHQL